MTGETQRRIASIMGLDQETVSRILADDEYQLLIRGYRASVLKAVPKALMGLHWLIEHTDRTAIIETLYGAKVLIDRHEAEHVEEEDPVRTYDASRILFYQKYGKWPTDAEEIPFDKKIPKKAITKGMLPG
jgi:hypothetical protein